MVEPTHPKNMLVTSEKSSPSSSGNKKSLKPPLKIYIYMTMDGGPGAIHDVKKS